MILVNSQCPRPRSVAAMRLLWLLAAVALALTVAVEGSHTGAGSGALVVTAGDVVAIAHPVEHEHRTLQQEWRVDLAAEGSHGGVAIHSLHIDLPGRVFVGPRGELPPTTTTPPAKALANANPAKTRKWMWSWQWGDDWDGEYADTEEEPEEEPVEEKEPEEEKEDKEDKERAVTGAVVRFSSDSDALFPFFEVVSPAPGVVHVRHRAGMFGTLADVYMLTEIEVVGHAQVYQLQTSGGADVIVETGVLVDTQSASSDGLVISIHGSGDVYIVEGSNEQVVQVPQVSVGCVGSGDLFWAVGGSLRTNKFDIGSTGSGNAVVVVKDTLSVSQLEIGLVGSGDFCLTAPARLEATKVEVGTAGSGDIVVRSNQGTCEREEADSAGSGDLFLGDMRCQYATIGLLGSGDAVVQAEQEIKGARYSSGDVWYMGAAPARISDRYDSDSFSNVQGKDGYAPIARALPESTKERHERAFARMCRLPTTPERLAVRVKLQYSALAMSLPVLVVLALISLCYLRCQRKRHPRDRSRRRRHGRHQGQEEMLPLMTATPAQQLYGQLPATQMQPSHPQQQQQQQYQQSSSQVFV